jgi:hypothetical protein
LWDYGAGRPFQLFGAGGPTLIGHCYVSQFRLWPLPQLYGWSTVMKRECLDAAGYFNEALPALADLELFIRLSKRFDFFRIPEPLVRYYESDGLSKKPRRSIACQKIISEALLQGNSSSQR